MENQQAPLKYEKIWKKVLNNDEKVEYEFTVSTTYVVVAGIISILFSLVFIGISMNAGIFVFALVVFYWFYYKKNANAYAFTDKRVVIHKGLWSTKTISINYEKITDLEVKDAFGLGNLIINTAGKPISEGVLLNISNPYEIKKKLTDLIESIKKPSN